MNKQQVKQPLEGIWTINAEAKTVFASKQMARILKTTVSEMLGQHSFEFVYPEDVKAAQALFQQKKNGDIDPFTFKLRRKDGSGVWVKVQGTPLIENGKFKGIVGTFREIA